jgi:hypothetical protein
MPPTTLIDSLHAVRRKVRLLAIASGMGVATVAAVGLLAALVVVDWTLVLDKFPRMLFLGAAGAAFVYVLWRWLLKPAVARLNIGDVAGRLEHTFPQFDDRLRSTVNFVQGEIPGSAAMQNRVAAEASAMASHVDLGRVIRHRPVYLATSSGLLAALLLAGVFLFGSHADWFRVAANRLLLGDAQWPKSVEIAVDGTLPSHVPIGQSVHVKAHLTRGDKESRRVSIYYRYDDGQWQQSEMKRGADGTYSAILSTKIVLAAGRTSSNLQTRIEAGDDSQTLPTVSVVPPLQILRADAELTPPPYLQAEKFPSVNLAEAKAVAVFGSQVAIRFTFNKPLESGMTRLETVNPRQPIPAFSWEASSAPGVVVASFSPRSIMRALPVPSPSGFTTFRLKVRATDTDGLLNGEGDEFEFTIKDDQLPTVEIVQPKEWSREDRTAIAGFDIAALARDDFGIHAAQLVVDRVKSEAPAEGAAPTAPGPATQPAARSHWEIPLVNPPGTADSPEFAGSPTAALGATFEPTEGTPELRAFAIGYHLELESLLGGDLKKGDVLEYYVRVRDNFMLEDKVHPVSYFSSYRWVKSGKVTVTIISMQEFMQRKEIEVAQHQQGIKILAASEHLQNLETQTLKAGMEKNKKYDPADQAQTERLARDQSQTQTQTNEHAEGLKRILKEMAENKAPKEGLQKNVGEVENDLRKTANKEMRDARNNLDAARDPQFAKADADPKPADPKLGDPKLNDPQASDSKADGAKKDEQKQGEPKPGEPKQGDSKPGDPKSANPKQGEQKPGDPKAGDPKAGDPKQGDPKTAAAKTGEQKPGDPKAGDPKSGDPKQGDPKTAVAKASEQKPADPKAGDPKAGDPKAGNPKAGDPKTGDPKAGDPKAGDPKAGDPKAGDPKAGDPKAGDPKAGDPKPGDPKSQEQKQRENALAKASDNQQKAEENLNKAMNKLGQLDGVQAAIEALQNAKNQQKALEDKFREANKTNAGKKPEQLTKPDQEKNKELAQDQKDQAANLDRALENMQKAAEKMSKQDPAAETMKQASQMGKQKGLSGKQKQAAEDMKQNQQAKAQKNQHEVELGIDELINKLKEAQRKQLEELARKLAEMQQLVNDLVQRQAGHNIDNLLIQGGVKRFEQLEQKDRDELLTSAGREAKDLTVAPKLSELSPHQEQTYDKTVSLAKKAETLPEPASSVKLTEAAGHMERAVVHLRAAKLPDAYKPPQLEAFVALLDAKKLIDEAAKKAQDDVDDDDKETIKEMYIAMLAKQKEIGAEIRRVDALPRDNGDLPRAEVKKLEAQGDKQGELIKKAGEIGEQLKKLESVVYDWANKDIMKAMGKVKDNLAKPDTSRPTQVAEKHAEDQLQDMIDSLVTKKRKSPFDNRAQGGGGGGGQKKPKMPSEVELRLLKKNQEAVNEGTIEEAKKKQKDKEELLALGDRQHEIRGVFDKVLKQAGNAEGVGAKPAKDTLPEDAKKDDIDDDELQRDLLGGKGIKQEKVDTGTKITGDRMYIAGDRLKVRNDPGPVTQLIQKRIVINIDELIKMAQQTQSNSKPKPSKAKGDEVKLAKVGDGDPQPGGKKPGSKQQKKGGQNPAEQSSLSQGGAPQTDTSKDIKLIQQEWATLHPRERKAVQEGGGEEVIPKYRSLVEEYFKSLSEQASKKKN